MMDRIYLVEPDGRLNDMMEQPYDNEAALQTLIEKYPKLLAGEQIDERSPRRWLLIKREMGVAAGDEEADRWSLDHLFVDQDGIPTLVEVKRSTDTRIRRNVVGQMLDYAANAVAYWPIEKIRQSFFDTCNEMDVDPESTLINFLDPRPETDEEDLIEAFWNTIKQNLNASRIRMVFLADEIPGELRRIVEFLDEQMSEVDVFAIEVKQFKGKGLTTLVPTLVGRSAKVDQKKRRTSDKKKRAMRPEFVAIIEEYDRTAEAGLLLHPSEAARFRQIRPQGWKYTVHYEFLDSVKKGVGVEIHIEEPGHEELRGYLESLQPVLDEKFPNAKQVYWHEKWLSVGCRVRILFHNDEPPHVIVLAMKTLIAMTHEEISSLLSAEQEMSV